MFSLIQFFAVLQTVAHQAPLSMGFSRQEYWSGLPFPSPMCESESEVTQLPCLFNLYAEYIIRNAGLEEAQAGIKIAGKNINNLRYADNTAIMAESEELKSL